MANGKPQELESFKKQSCYIMQEDQLHMQLTIREAIEFALKLKCLTLSLNPCKHKMVNISNFITIISIFANIDVLYNFR